MYTYIMGYLYDCFACFVSFYTTGKAEIPVSSSCNEKESDELRHDRSELADLLNVPSVSDVRS